MTNKPKHGGAVVTMKVTALTIPVNNELTLWLEGSNGKSHILKIYNDGDGVAHIRTINTKIDEEKEA